MARGKEFKKEHTGPEDIVLTPMKDAAKGAVLVKDGREKVRLRESAARCF